MSDTTPTSPRRKQRDGGGEGERSAIVVGESDLKGMIEDLRSPDRTYAVIGITASLDGAEPVIAPGAVREIVGPSARIYSLPSDELLRGLRSNLGSRLALSRGEVRCWWPEVNRRSDPEDHPLVAPLEGEGEPDVLATLAAQFDLSRPPVRREINLIEGVRAHAEQQRADAEDNGRKAAQMLRDAHVERQREVTRAEKAEAELATTRRQLNAACAVGGASRDVGVLTLGLDAVERERTAEAFRENVGSLRERAGLTQRELAARCFITATYVADLEQGTRNPTLSVLLLLSRGLGASVADLTDGVAPFTREATRKKLRDLLAEQPGSRMSTKHLVRATQLRASYVSQTLGYMTAYGETIHPESGVWALAPPQPRSGR